MTLATKQIRLPPTFNRVCRVSVTIGGVVWLGLAITVTSGWSQTTPSPQVPPKNQHAQLSTQLSTQLSKEAVSPRILVDKQTAMIFRSTDEFELKCDLYRAADPTSEAEVPPKPLPAIIAIHGGAWRTGSRLAMVRHARAFAKAGYVVMAIDYRLAPRHPFPAQIHDCKHAVRWLKANATRLGIDPQRIGAFGYSAGAHLAGLLGTTNADDGLEGDISPQFQPFDSSVACVAAGGAPCEFSWIKEDASTLKYWLEATRGESPDTYRTVSPLTHVDRSDVPFYFFHGQYDLIVPVDSSLKMHQALIAAGVSSKHEIALLTGHMSTFSMMTWASKSVEFFDRHLKTANEATQTSIMSD